VLSEFLFDGLPAQRQEAKLPIRSGPNGQGRTVGSVHVPPMGRGGVCVLKLRRF
jgi:hypothetical protein